MPDTFSMDFACLQISPFGTVILYSVWDISPNKIGKHAQVKHYSLHHRFKLLNLPIKRQAFLTGRLFCVGVALNFNSFGTTVLQHSPGRAASKACWLTWFIHKIPKILRVFGTVLWKRTFYRNDNLSTTCQCRQLNLNLLST